MRKVFLLFILLLSNYFCYSQNIKDDSFKNVIRITDNDVVKFGENYLFTTSIPSEIKTPIVFVQAKIPLNLLTSIYPKFSKIIVITPNWSFYQKTTTSPRGEPIASSIVYEFIRENEKLLKDSVVLMGKFPEMEFIIENKLKANQMKIFFTEYFGSVCCPMDLQWDNSPTREEFIESFENENKVEIINTYYKSLGKEGECVFYYTLYGLSNNLKLKFILERSFYRIINRHLKEIYNVPQIYTPEIIEIDDTVKKIDYR